MVSSYFHLALCIVAIHFLIKTKFAYLPESVAVVVLGAMVGGLIKILNAYDIADWQVIFICHLTTEGQANIVCFLLLFEVNRGVFNVII